ncbi:uncharacterized protein LAESUDRAFT_639618 [Laetiporus sulphureus 93-53]|uniref:Uncharacterized protein n=1 Tax=Laetiporus sulphureus 93-53 TaxID=1314785 RepID=A0A165IFS1_9APHY|nr:uncharacterized protein LAESUDRAFT_639618 [Laetiporus sulphureus 93-53]KZT13011.1 hypothetical protein LAESUDRAFT_639618 [Laetiporus sulphureus 93-53]
MHRAAESTQDVSKSKPALDVNTQILPLARRHTDRPSISPPPARVQPTPLSHGHTAKTNYGTEPEPSTPNSSSHSGNSSSWGRSSGKRVARAAHPPFKFEPAVPPIPGSPASDERKRTMSNTESVKSVSHAPLPLPPLPRKEARKGRSLDLGLGLNWAPSRIREDAVLRSVNSSGAIADAGLRARARWRSISPIEDGSFGSSGDASDLAKAFHEVLGDAAYATFKNYVHRYDALAIPLDGHYGLMHHVQRLLDSAPGLDARRKQSLLDRFFRVVQANR